MKSWYDFYKEIRDTYGDEPEHALIEYLDLIERGKVLDLGVGDGRNSLFLASMGCEVTGVDMKSENIELFSRKAKELDLDVESVVDDIRNIKIKEEEYSLIILSWVLNFFNKSDINSILDKVKKGLKKGGIIYVGAFTNLDYFYEINKSRSIKEENTLYFEEDNSYRHYFTKAEFLEYFNDMETVCFKEGKVLDLDPKGKHYHDMFEYMGVK